VGGKLGGRRGEVRVRVPWFGSRVNREDREEEEEEEE
jgi:hypothetical protein